MPLDRRTLVSAAFAASILTSGSAFAASEPTGVWMNDTGRGAIEIKQCGDSLCGHVIWVKDTTDTKGCGRQILGEITPAGSGTWGNGWVYSPERKKRYDVEIKPLSDGTLRVMGYAGSKLFSRTMIWKPAPSDLVRCNSNEQTAAADIKTAPASSTTVKASSVEELKYAPKSEAQPAPETKKPAAAAAPAEKAPAQEEEEVASDDTGEEGGSDMADNLGKYFKKGDDGNCNLDLPWVKLNFKCEK